MKTNLKNKSEEELQFRVESWNEYQIGKRHSKDEL